MRWPRLRLALLALFVVGLAASITVSQIALAALTLELALSARGRGIRLPLAIPLALFAAWTLVTALASARPQESLVAAKSLWTLTAFWVVLNAIPDRQSAHRFARVLLVAAGVVALAGIVQVAACPPEAPATGVLRWFFRKCERAHGAYSIYMTLAGVLSLVLVSSLPRLLRGTRDTLWMSPVWLVGLVGLGLTYVRGAWLGFAAGMVVAVATSRRRALGGAAVLVAVALALLMLPGVMSRAGTIGSREDKTTAERVHMLVTGWRIVREHALTGVGPGQVKHVYGTYMVAGATRSSTSHLHNTPLQILVERGVPGLLLFLLVFAAFFRQARRILVQRPSPRAEDRALVVGCMLAIATFLIGGLFEYNFGDTEVLMVACSLMALPFVVEADLAKGESAQ